MFYLIFGLVLGSEELFKYSLMLLPCATTFTLSGYAIYLLCVLGKPLIDGFATIPKIGFLFFIIDGGFAFVIALGNISARIIYSFVR